MDRHRTLLLRAAALAFFLLLPSVVWAQNLTNELGYDQEWEEIAIFIDGEEAGTIRVDGKRENARLRLLLDQPVHRYKLVGETSINGRKYTVKGEGLIVTQEKMDEIGEVDSALEAVAAYRQLVSDLAEVAPAEFLEYAVQFHPGPKASLEDVKNAERRLGHSLPAGYAALVTELGPFRLGELDDPWGAVLAPSELANAVDYYGRQMEADEWDAADIRKSKKQIERRFPRASKDMVIDFFEIDEPTLITKQRCPRGESAFLLPTSDFSLLGANYEDNPFMALIDYDDDIMGEPVCLTYGRLLGYSLHDHLMSMASEVLFARGPFTTEISFYRDSTDDQAREIWMSLVE